MNTTVTTTIFLRANRANAAGKHPIYVRITVNSKRSEFTTKKYVDPIKWDARRMQMKGNTEEARIINAYLESLKNRITQIHMVLDLQGKPFTSQDIIHSLTGKNLVKEKTIVPVFQEHNKRVKALIGIEYAADTHQRYETTLKHLIIFMKSEYNVNDVPLSKIDHTFIADFDFYFRSVRKCDNNTTVKYIKNFKKIIRICLANGWMNKDPFLNYKVRLDEVKREILSLDEIKCILEKDINIERLIIIRDIFIFACFTGLSYIDVKNLTPTHIVKGIDGQLWIHTFRQKTEVESKIPLLETALQIIEKYKDHQKCLNEGTILPVPSNQRVNAYLKELADICGINKSLSFHCARHTFATTITLNNGVPIETVSKMLGHRKIKTTQHYAKILDRKVSEDMERLKNRLNDTTNVIQNRKLI